MDSPTRPGRGSARSPAASGRLDLALALVGDPDSSSWTSDDRLRSARAAQRVGDRAKPLRVSARPCPHHPLHGRGPAPRAHRVAVMAGGRIVAEGSPDSIAGGAAGRSSVIRFRSPPASARRPARPCPRRRRARGDRDRGADARARRADRVGGGPRPRARPASAWPRGPSRTRTRLVGEDGGGPPRRGRAAMRDVGLLVRQVGYEQRTYWRTPSSAFFTFAFPLVLLFIFTTMYRTTSLAMLGGISYAQYFAPGIVAFGVISACYTNIAITLCFRRDFGVPQAPAGTPLPPWIFMGGHIGSSVVVSALLTAITTAVGMAVYGVSAPAHGARCWSARRGRLLLLRARPGCHRRDPQRPRRAVVNGALFRCCSCRARSSRSTPRRGWPGRVVVPGGALPARGVRRVRPGLGRRRRERPSRPISRSCSPGRRRPCSRSAASAGAAPPLTPGRPRGQGLAWWCAPRRRSAASSPEWMQSGMPTPR